MKRKATDIAREVKKSLEKEGYEGEMMSVVDSSDDAGRPKDVREAQMRDIYRRYYKKFKGKVYLPKFAVKEGRAYAALDYYGHLVSKVDVSGFKYGSIDWDLSDSMAKAKDAIYRLTLDQDVLERVEEREVVLSETDEQVKAWLVASLSFDHFSFKQIREVVERVVQRLYKVNVDMNGKLSLVKFILREKIAGFIGRETDRITHETFDELFKEKKLCFYLECLEARFEIPPRVEVRAKLKRLIRDDNEQIQQSLFDFVPDDFNEYEKAVALYLDSSPQVLWWYRNLVGPDQFSIQGYRRPRIYPDFVVQQGKNKKPIASVLVVESKGKHLKGSEDTKYKRSVADYFGKVGHKVPWQKLAQDFKDNTFRVQVLDEGEYADRDWKDELKRLLEQPE
jgi:type III restriction enzyme